MFEHFTYPCQSPHAFGSIEFTEVTEYNIEYAVFRARTQSTLIHRTTN